MLRIVTRIALLTLVAAPLLGHADGARRKEAARPITRFHATPSPKGTVVLYHGWAATPGQWDELARRLHEERGYDVIQASLPGHGFVDRGGHVDLGRLPKAGQADRYARFADGIYRLARARGGPVQVVGFSAGGTHALWNALRARGDHAPERVVLVNPFLGKTPARLGPLRLDPIAPLRGVARLGALGASLLERLHTVMTLAHAHAKAGRDDYGFVRPLLTHVLALDQFAAKVRDAAAPQGFDGRRLRFVLARGDATADPARSLDVARRLGASSVVLARDDHNLFASELPAAARAQVYDEILAGLAP